MFWLSFVESGQRMTKREKFHGEFLLLFLGKRTFFLIPDFVVPTLYSSEFFFFAV